MRKKKNKMYLKALIAVILLLTCVWIYIKNKKLEENGVYSIATITNVEAIRGSMRVTITFPYRGRIITNSSGGFSIWKNEIGERYYIRFSPNHPNGNFNLLLDLKVPDSIKQVPYNGWMQIP